MYKRYIIALPVLIIVSFVFTSCATLFRGILFPRVFFTFEQVDPPEPPSSVDKILDEADKYPQTVRFLIMQDGISFKKHFLKFILVRAPYTQWHLREVRCEWENKSALLGITGEYYMNVDEYKSKNGWYCTANVRSNGINRFVNFEKVFKGKKAGDEFYVDFILRYSFDDEPEIVQVIKYKVSTTKGESRLVIFS
jgi:hypothetical protein